jgi:hypothetical protein
VRLVHKGIYRISGEAGDSNVGDVAVGQAIVLLRFPFILAENVFICTRVRYTPSACDDVIIAPLILSLYGSNEPGGAGTTLMSTVFVICRKQ